MKTSPTTIRNSRPAIALLSCLAASGVVVAAGLLVMAMAALGEAPSSPVHAAVNVGGCAIGAYFAATTGASLWKRARAYWHCRATLDFEGVRLQLNPRRGSAATRLVPWIELVYIGWCSTRGADAPGIARLVARDGATESFSGLDFFRPRAVARRIAAAAGLPVASDSAHAPAR